MRHGVTEEDLTHGHPLLADPSARAIQEMLPALAHENLTVLRNVLRNSGDEEQRATAAYVIGYATRKRDIVNDLQYALRDADAGVRVNASRNLLALAVLARAESGRGSYRLAHLVHRDAEFAILDGPQPGGQGFADPDRYAGRGPSWRRCASGRWTR